MKTLISILLLFTPVTLWAEEMSLFAKKIEKTFIDSVYIHRKETTALSIYLYATDTPPAQLDRKFASLITIKNWRQIPNKVTPDQPEPALLKRVYRHKTQTHKAFSFVVTPGKRSNKKYLFTITKVNSPKK